MNGKLKRYLGLALINCRMADEKMPPELRDDEICVRLHTAMMQLEFALAKAEAIGGRKRQGAAAVQGGGRTAAAAIAAMVFLVAGIAVGQAPLPNIQTATVPGWTANKNFALSFIWAPAPGATNYSIAYGTNSVAGTTNSYPATNWFGTNLSGTISNLVRGRTYYFTGQSWGKSQFAFGAEISWPPLLTNWVSVSSVTEAATNLAGPWLPIVTQAVVTVTNPRPQGSNLVSAFYHNRVTVAESNNWNIPVTIGVR